MLLGAVTGRGSRHQHQQQGGVYRDVPEEKQNQGQVMGTLDAGQNRELERERNGNGDGRKEEEKRESFGAARNSRVVEVEGPPAYGEVVRV